MKMRGLLAIGICIIMGGGAIIGLSYRYEITQTAENLNETDRLTDELSKWIDERGKSNLLEDVGAEKLRAKAFLLALDHYMYVIKSDSSIEEAAKYANSHWNEYVNRRDQKEIYKKVQLEKDIGKRERDEKRKKEVEEVIKVRETIDNTKTNN